MEITLTIPAKSASTRIVGKNMIDFGGRPLICRTLEHAAFWPYTRFLVATDSDAISEVARSYGASIFPLTQEDITDKRNAGGIWRDIAKLYSGDHILTSITSPFRFQSDIERGWALWLTGEYDIVCSCNEIKFWLLSAEGIPEVPLEETLVLSQFLKPRYHLNGSFYISSADYLTHCNYVFEGKLGLATTSVLTALDIDTPANLAEARQLLKTFKE